MCARAAGIEPEPEVEKKKKKKKKDKALEEFEDGGVANLSSKDPFGDAGELGGGSKDEGYVHIRVQVPPPQPPPSSPRAPVLRSAAAARLAARRQPTPGAARPLSRADTLLEFAILIGRNGTAASASLRSPGSTPRSTRRRS